MKHLITSGCSFTAGEIPLPHDNSDEWFLKGSVWPHFCFAKMMTDKNDAFTNLAMPGGGNIAAMNNLVYWLEKNKQNISLDNTVIGFNITELSRWDTPCSVDNPNANKELACIDTQGLTHPSLGLGLSWITHAVNWPDRNLDNVDIISALSVLHCFSYLEQQGLRYFFMLMNEKILSDAPLFLQQALSARIDRWVKFDGTIGMFEYVKSKNQLTNDMHPTIEGHRALAAHVQDFLKTNG